MKRGRPNIRRKISPLILKRLEDSKMPLTISSLARLVSKDSGTQISWNTIQKYLKELIETNKVQAIPLPHSKKEGKDGLTVYVLKR
jgi:hypothetical protein